MSFRTGGILFVIFALLVAQWSCRSSEYYLRSGSYDRAIAKAVKKLQRSPDKEDEVLVLEEAFAKANNRDSSRIAFLKKEGQPDNWQKIYELYKQMQRRQELVKPLVPLNVPSQNRDAHFDFKNYDRLIIESKRKAAEYFYAHAQKLLEENSRQSARKAYYELEEVKELYPDYKEVDQLSQRARFLGTNKVLFKIVNDSETVLPEDFVEEIKKMDIQELNKEWINYYTSYDSTLFYDYHIVANIKDIKIGPDAYHEKNFVEEKEIQDGYKYLEDDNGNLVKDSLGDPIKVKEYKTISAHVTKIEQKKVATIHGAVEFRDHRNEELLKNEPITADAVFEHYSAQAYGDLRALSKDTKALLDHQPVPFPKDEAMLQQALTSLKGIIKQAVWDNDYILSQ